jgi:hypothetical protein
VFFTKKTFFDVDPILGFTIKGNLFLFKKSLVCLGRTVSAYKKLETDRRKERRRIKIFISRDLQ